jgi:hypothetical protein
MLTLILLLACSKGSLILSSDTAPVDTTLEFSNFYPTIETINTTYFLSYDSEIITEEQCSKGLWRNGQSNPAQSVYAISYLVTVNDPNGSSDIDKVWLLAEPYQISALNHQDDILYNYSSYYTFISTNSFSENIDWYLTFLTFCVVDQSGISSCADYSELNEYSNTRLTETFICTAKCSANGSI